MTKNAEPQLSKDWLSTPRTDGIAYVVSSVNVGAEVVSADFARQLERELQMSHRLIDEAAGVLGRRIK